MALSAVETSVGAAIADVVLADRKIQNGRLVVPIRTAVPAGFPTIWSVGQSYGAGNKSASLKIGFCAR